MRLNTELFPRFYFLQAKANPETIIYDLLQRPPPGDHLLSQPFRNIGVYG